MPLPLRTTAPSIACIVASGMALASVPSGAGAQAVPEQQVTAGFKATIGLGLLGTELGFMIPTACGLDEVWSLITFPVVGAAGGIVGGYYLDRADSAAASVSTLAIGLALVVPTIVVTVGATRYSADDLEDDTRAYRRALEGSGLVRFDGSRFRLRVPGLAVQPSYAVRDGATERTAALHVSLASGAF